MVKKYPFVKQIGSSDCGASTLLMIIKYYNGNIDLDSLRELTKTTSNGTTAYHLIKAGGEIGLNGLGIKCSLKDINKMVLPCIASTTINNTFKHFVVIYKIDQVKKNLIIADPATKIKKISFAEFEEMFNNVILTFTPFKTLINEKTTNVIPFFFKIIASYKKEMLNILILSLLLTIFSIITSFYFKYMIDGINESKDYLLLIFIIFAIISILKIVSDYFRNILLIYLNQKIDLSLTKDTFTNVINLPYNYYHNRTTGEIVSRINEISTIRDTISKAFLTIFIDLPLTILAFFLLLYLNKTLFLIALVILISYIIIVLVFKPMFKKYIKEIQEQKAYTTSYMVNAISSYETIKGLNIENYICSTWEEKYIKFLNKIFKFDIYYNLQYLFKELVDNIGFIVIIFIGSLLVIDNKMTIGSLLTFNSLLVYFLDPIRNFVDFDTNIREAKEALNRIISIRAEKKDNGIINKKIVGNIKYQNLTFSYNERDLVLDNVNLEIKQYEKVMILGNSGSGKSTLLKLLMGYYQVPRNTIYLNNIDINDYKSESISNSIAYISQSESLFTDSLETNIKLGRKISDNNFLEMTKLCYVDEIINKNNTNYKMLIEENGFNLSGGEKQRIILARALLKEFDILIIDEGLNQIDNNLERKILKNVFTKYKDKTIIIISHRLENIDLFDRIVELKHGKIERENNKNGL